ncbi:MAG: hypothetical protein WC091_13390 [Sulfuricellaceae bacterium]
MQPEPPLDDDESRELLEKVDALLKRHQPKRYIETATELPESPEPTGALALPELPELSELEPAKALEQPEPPRQPERQPELPRMAKAEAPEPDNFAFDDIPVLTDIIDEPSDAHVPADAPVSGGQLLELEERLYRELEAHLVPQLSMAFGKALNELLAQAKIHISVAVREHLVQELRKQTQGQSARD